MLQTRLSSPQAQAALRIKLADRAVLAPEQALASDPARNQLLVRLDLDLNGILRVTATEKATGLAKQVVIDNAMERFRQRSSAGARDRLDALLPDQVKWSLADEERLEEPAEKPPMADPELDDSLASANALLAKSDSLARDANPEDAAEMQRLAAALREAIASRSLAEIERIVPEVEDLVFYLADH